MTHENEQTSDQKELGRDFSGLHDWTRRRRLVYRGTQTYRCGQNSQEDETKGLHGFSVLSCT